MITDAEYYETQTKLNLAVALLRDLDLRAFLDRISIFDPCKPVALSVRMREGDTIEAVRNIASAALKLQDVCSKEYDLELERRGARATQRTPDGLKGIRDADSPCEHFAPGEPDGDCAGDGNYLCDQCKELRGWDA